MKQLLIVDDEANHRLMLKINLEDRGFSVTEAENGLEALSLVAEQSFAAILLDIRMDIMDGLTLLTHLNQKEIQIPVIMITAFSDVKTAVESMKLGAFDYMTKPVDIDSLDILLNSIPVESEVETTTDSPTTLYHFEGIYSENGLGTIINLLKMVAPTDATVMITGESGTGKELVAKSVHQNSNRRDQPFLAINCAAINENLIESELFGHEKGAFTGATASKAGKFKLADKGTLFLDEIGELSLQTQAKLLRTLQDKTFETVGGTKTQISDVRIVTATNRDLQQMVDDGAFREDLFFRINVFPIHLPPLRDRTTEVPLLIDFFIKKYALSFGKIIKKASKDFVKTLQQYDFPGNIRELENIIERSIILSSSEILESAVLPPLKRKNETQTTASLDVKENEKILIKEALTKTGNNKTKAAEILGISRRSLHNKINDYEA